MAKPFINSQNLPPKQMSLTWAYYQQTALCQISQVPPSSRSCDCLSAVMWTISDNRKFMRSEMTRGFCCRDVAFLAISLLPLSSVYHPGIPFPIVSQQQELRWAAGSPEKGNNFQNPHPGLPLYQHNESPEWITTLLMSLEVTTWPACLLSIQLSRLQKGTGLNN